MKKRRKHSRCLNCQEPLERNYNYCPNCGQENTDHHVSLGLLLKEFTSNFFSLDSRFAHTFLPFLIKPGKITNAFLDGRRVYYANPIRWYLVISIFHFFFMAKMFQPTVKDKKDRVIESSDNVELTEVQFDSLMHLPDSAYSGWPLSTPHTKMANHLMETTNMTSQEILDSLQLDSLSYSDRFVKNQFLRMGQETKASLSTYLIRQIPLIIFFILPIYAVLLKLFFWRKGLYIKHLVHSLHLHSFYFFLMGWTWIFSLLIEDFEDYGILIATLITFVYAVISYRNVYKVKIIWSTFRAMCIGILYAFAVSFALIAGIIISIALI